MRRKAGALVPLEQRILDVAAALRLRGVHEFHGFQMMGELKDDHLAYAGTIYRALARMERMGLLVSHWKAQTGDDCRPRRRYYRLVDALVAHGKACPVSSSRLGCRED